jgi:myo-inositol 2-dehydrogenase/D-chiro-inositol 1-dehydrogenase
MNQPTQDSPFNRRSFLKTSGAVVGGALLTGLSVQRFAHAAAGGDDTLKVALIGCGGRGSGAADQALSNVSAKTKLVAVADVFQDRLDGSLRQLKQKHGEKVDVPKERQFVGFDGYKQAISTADVVILATPPGFRPAQFEEAVNQGKHVFTEKPVAVDGPGVRKFLAAAEEAKRKNLKVGVGLQRHHHAGHIEAVKRLQDGQIGDIVAMQAYWNGNTPWVNTRASLESKAGRKLSEMEYQMRNWYYFVWICGDHIVEQHIHNLDMINWLKNGHPTKARGNGGCETRKGPDYGEIFDHHVVEFTYGDGSICFSQCRHQQGCWNDVSQHAIGAKGRADLERNVITGPNAWRFRGEAKNPYQQEHDDLFEAIVKDKPFNEAFFGAESTLTAIMGRMSTYTGKDITWEQALNSKVDTMPKHLALDAPTLVNPLPNGLYPIPVPGDSTWASKVV